MLMMQLGTAHTVLSHCESVMDNWGVLVAVMASKPNVIQYCILQSTLSAHAIFEAPYS